MIAAVNANQCQQVCLHAAGMPGMWTCEKTHVDQTGHIYPRYQLIALKYAPPGEGSSVTYGNVSTNGSQIDLKETIKNSLIVGVEGTVSVSVEHMTGVSVGSTFEFSEEQGSSIETTSHKNAVDHQTDQFTIWLNPAILLTERNGVVATRLETRDGGPPQVVTLTARELSNPSEIPAQKKTLLAKLSTDDYRNILAMDPMFGMSPAADPSVVDPNRFKYIETDEMWGPDVSGDPTDAKFYSVSVSNEDGVSSAATRGLSVDFSVETGFDFFGIAGEKIKVGGKIEYEYESTKTHTNARTATADLKLESPAVGYRDSIDVYWDRLFKVFLFRQWNTPPGVARDANYPAGAIDVTLLQKGSSRPAPYFQILIGCRSSATAKT